MRVLMLGWEFPPHIVGGLGVACYGLVRGLAAEGASVTFVRAGPGEVAAVPGVRVVPVRGPAEPEVARATPVATVRAYETAAGYAARAAAGPAGATAFLQQVEDYAAGIEALARSRRFDVVHAHDWMAYPAGLRARAVSGTPLVCHVHSTEFDRCGAAGDPRIVAIERGALTAADRVITVSRFTRQTVVERYGVDPAQVYVVHNAIDRDTLPPAPAEVIKPWERVVVFLGRLVPQKGPQYFVEAAATVLERCRDVRFVLAGRGEMLPELIHRVARLRRGREILFAGFLDRAGIGRILRMADLYVMTSVSEPFGLAALEAMAHGVPVILPRQAGVGEVVGNVLKVDFWDVRLLADRIEAVLRRAPLRRLLGRLGRQDADRLSWREAARRCLAVYEGLVRRSVAP